MSIKLVQGGEKRVFKLTVLVEEQMDINLLKISAENFTTASKE